MEKSFIHLIEVIPDFADWDEFLAMSVDYIVENWPHVVGRRTTSEFKEDYALKLKERLQEEGVRGLFLVDLNGSKIGLINVYVVDRTLHLAEFYVKKTLRGKGYGHAMKMLIEEWGRKRGANKLLIEVDKELVSANQFWQSFRELHLNPSGNRNLYYQSL